MSEQQILEQLQGDNVEEIREAAYAAGNLRLESAVPHLVAQIQSHNIGVQEAVDRALRKIGGAAAVRGAAPVAVGRRAHPQYSHGRAARDRGRRLRFAEAVAA